MNKLLMYTIVTAFAVLTLGGCADQLVTKSETVMDSIETVGSSIWSLATDWIPGIEQTEVEVEVSELEVVDSIGMTEEGVNTP